MAIISWLVALLLFGFISKKLLGKSYTFQQNQAPTPPTISSHWLGLTLLIWFFTAFVAAYTPTEFLQTLYLALRRLLAPPWLTSLRLLLPGEWAQSYPVISHTYRLSLCLLLWALAAKPFIQLRLLPFSINRPFSTYRLFPIFRSALWALGAVCLIQSLRWGTGYLFNQPLTPPPDQLPTYRLPLTLMLLNLGLLSPMTQELLFRRWLQSWVMRWLNPYLSILIAALAYALAHRLPSKELSLANSICHLALGIWLGLCYAREKRISCTIATHALYNAITLRLTLFLAQG